MQTLKIFGFLLLFCSVMAAPAKCYQPPVGTCDSVTMVQRSAWQARDSRQIVLMGTPVELVFIHHTDMSECFTQAKCAEEMRVIQNFHMDNRSWDDIGYNFLVGEDGQAYVGRGWDRVGAHTLGWNDVAIAISVMGEYSQKLPNDAALHAVNAVIECGIKKGKISPNYKLFGHRNAGTTSCPGNSLYNLIRTWPHFGVTLPVKPTPLPPAPGLCPSNQ